MFKSKVKAVIGRRSVSPANLHTRSAVSPFLFFAFSIRLLFLLSLAVSLAAQTGGTYDLTHAVVAGGGAARSSAGTIAVGGTAGQAAAGDLSFGGTYQLRGGFWASQDLAPTSAGVSISGRVITADGAGIRNATISLTSLNGVRRNAITASFGFFRFDRVEAGQTYILEIGSKRFTFANPSRTVFVDSELGGQDFVAEPQ